MDALSHLFVRHDDFELAVARELEPSPEARLPVSGWKPIAVQRPKPGRNHAGAHHGSGDQKGAARDLHANGGSGGHRSARVFDGVDAPALRLSSARPTATRIAS